MDYHQMTPPCGIDCFNCPAYLANEDEKLRNVLAKFFDTTPERAVCKGCRNENGIVPSHKLNEPCNVYKCTAGKNIRFCFECSDFPCDYLHPFADQASQRPHNTKVYNLCLIKKMGLEAWAATKAKKVRETYFKDKWKI